MILLTEILAVYGKCCTNNTHKDIHKNIGHTINSTPLSEGTVIGYGFEFCMNINDSC